MPVFHHNSFSVLFGFIRSDKLLNQPNIPERGRQVKQMRRIYQTAKLVLSWLGPDTREHLAVAAIKSIVVISGFLCQKLGISMSDLRSVGNIYQELVLKNRARLPLPSECEFSTDATWRSWILVLFSSIFHPSLGCSRNICEQRAIASLWP